MRTKVEFPRNFPKVGDTIRFLAQSENYRDVRVTVEATVVARMYWDAGNSGHNLITSAPEFREIEHHGPPEPDSTSSWGESVGRDVADGNRNKYIIYDMEIL
jgi:hypothetical protein